MPFISRFLPVALALMAAATAAPAALPLPSDTLPLAAVLPEPVMLKATNAARIFSDRKLTSLLGDVASGTPVRLLAYAPEVYYVSARGTRGSTLTGWVNPRHLSEVDPKILAEAEERQKLQEDIEEAVKNRDVILGMTRDDVQRSLGRPQSRSRSRSRDHERETWTYVKYESVPQVQNVIGPDGFPYQTTVNIKVPVGRTLIHFEGGLVESYEDLMDNNRGGALVPSSGPVMVTEPALYPGGTTRSRPAPRPVESFGGGGTNRVRQSR